MILLLAIACALASRAAGAQPTAAVPSAPQAPAPAPPAAQWPNEPIPGMPVPASAQWPNEPIPGLSNGPILGVRSPVELDYDEGDPIPLGYHLESRRRKGMIAGGAAVFAGVYLTSVLYGAIAQLGVAFSSVGCSLAGSASACASPDDYRPLYVPLAGPFVTMATAHPRSGGFVGLGLLGAGQLGGVGLLVAGIAIEHKVLLRNGGTGALSPSIVPFVGMGTAGLAGRF